MLAIAITHRSKYNSLKNILLKKIVKQSKNNLIIQKIQPSTNSIHTFFNNFPIIYNNQMQ